MRITDKQKEVLIKYVDNAEALIEGGDLEALLLELDDTIIDKGLDENYNSTSLGVTLQKLYDAIYIQNKEATVK